MDAEDALIDDVEVDDESVVGCEEVALVVEGDNVNDVVELEESKSVVSACTV